jgi:hypothetical protein
VEAMQVALAASIHRTKMARSIGRKSGKEIDATEATLRLVAVDIATTCGFDHAAFVRACGLSL